MSMPEIPMINAIGVRWFKEFNKEEKVFSFVKVAQKRIYESVNEQDNQEVVEEELNQILDKISKSGYDSLSKYEKRRLFKASQKNE